MSALIVLLIVSVLIAGGFLIAFLVSVRRGHFDDLVTPSVRVLCDELEALETPDDSRPHEER